MAQIIAPAQASATKPSTLQWLKSKFNRPRKAPELIHGASTE